MCYGNTMSTSTNRVDASVTRIANWAGSVRLSVMVCGLALGTISTILFFAATIGFSLLLLLWVGLLAVLGVGYWVLAQHSERSHRREVDAAWAALHQASTAHHVTVIEKENA
jgi:hypothetical protein